MSLSPLFLDVDPEDQALVLARFPDARFADGTLQGDALIDACSDAIVISTFIRTSFTSAVLHALPSLKLIVTRSVGFDHIDLDTCSRLHISVCNVPDYGSHVIAEHVFALLLSTFRHIAEGDRRTESGIFDYHGLRGITLKDKIIGIVGTGKIGRAVARIAFGFGMHILATDQCRTIELEELYRVHYVPFDTLLRDADIITLHVPALVETAHMINAAAFALMKKGVVLVNTARGSLIDSSALFDALNNGTVSLALLDVMEHESNFTENAALVSHPRVVSTPHIAFYADDSMKRMYEDCFESIAEWQSGVVPSHIVHPMQQVCDLPKIALS